MRSITIAVSLMLVAAACGTSSPSPANGSASTGTLSESTGGITTVAEATPTTAVALGPTFAGVTADTITIAVVSVDYGKLRDMFGVDLDYQDPAPVMQPLIDDLNANGGINGRTVEAVYRKFLPVGATDADRVCVEVTEDIGVFAVFGGFVGPGAQEVNLCLTETHDTMLIGLAGTTDQYARSTAPWIVDGMGQ